MHCIPTSCLRPQIENLGSGPQNQMNAPTRDYSGAFCNGRAF